ncbi:putative cellulose synthase catalytic subunit [Hordeum vulgare]|nr:putative cellulose synthase catalytic subunit [Hordeum vulgare]
MFDDIPPEQHALVPSFVGGGGNRIHLLPYADSNLPVQPRTMDPSKDIGADGELEAETGEAASHIIDGVLGFNCISKMLVLRHGST